AGAAMQLVSSQPAAALAPAAAGGAPQLRLARFEDLVALAGEKRDIALKVALERDVRLVRFEDGAIEFALAGGASRSLAAQLGARLLEWTGRRWVVAISSQRGEDTIAEKRDAARRERHQDAASHPLVRAALEVFPGAQIVDVTDVRPAGEETMQAGGDDDAGGFDD
ncbi:DNA polymerase III subunit gamma/tau, partial [Camelimonas abortus]